MKRFFPAFWVLSIIMALVSCNKERRMKVSFYYWQQSADTTDSTTTLIHDLEVHKFYVHVLDVVWDASAGKAVPVSKTAVDSAHPIAKQQVVPVIFIANDVIKRIDSNRMALLSKNILSAAGAFVQRMHSHQYLPELQVDCDWTPSTKDKYFFLLEEIKRQQPGLKLGVTIRLYPYKYPHQMGVPPADYGVLMCYNLGNIKDIRSENAILAVNELKQYLHAARYPLSLKPALPVFGWYVWFRGSSYRAILYLPPQLTQDAGFQKEYEHVYRVLRDTVLAGNYIRQGDLLRNEFPSAATLQASADLILSKLAGEDELIFFHWNESNLNYYDETIRSLVQP